MQHTRPSFVAFVLALLATVSACVTGPEAPPTPPEERGPGADPRALLDQLATESVRSDGHVALEPLVGAWDVVLHAADSGEPIARGTAELAWQLGGLVLEWRTELVVGERSAPSLALFGYDPRTNLYQLAWCSGVSSSMSLARGRGELDAVGIRLLAEERDPVTAEVSRARAVLRRLSEDVIELVQESEGLPGIWSAVTRTVYTRRGGAQPDAGIDLDF